MKKLLWLSVPVAAAVAALAVTRGGLVTSTGPTRPADRPAAAAPPSPAPGVPWFRDVTAAASIDFRHFDCATPMHYLQETMGSGLGWIDFNGDGWPDLFL